MSTAIIFPRTCANMGETQSTVSFENNLLQDCGCSYCNAFAAKFGSLLQVSEGFVDFTNLEILHRWPVAGPATRNSGFKLVQADNTQLTCTYSTVN